MTRKKKEKEKELPTLKTPEEELEIQLLEEDNIDNIKTIIDLFNVNIKKKNIIRTSKLNELQDKIYEQIDQRITDDIDTFSNRTLLEYFKVMQDTIDKANVDSEQMAMPNIQVNQNNLNITMGTELNRESRQKITDAIKNIIENHNVIDSEAHEIDEGEE